jgi:hypothetical protein
MNIALALALLQGPAPQVEMTTGGWAFMVLAWLGILSLTFFTFSKVLGGRR